MDGGQETAAPQRSSAVRRRGARNQDDEAWQVPVFGTQAVRNPGSHAGPAQAGRAGVDEKLARGVVELVGVHRPHDAQFVGHRRQLRDDVRHHLPGLAEFAELVGRPQQARPLVLDERELLAAYVRLRTRQAVQLVQLRLEVEQVQR